MRSKCKVIQWLANDLSEKATAPHFSTLAWNIPRTEEPGGLQSMASLRVGHDWATSLSLFTFMHWGRKWQPTPVFLPGESQGQRSQWAAVYGVAQSRTRLKRLSSSSSSSQWSKYFYWIFLNNKFLVLCRLRNLGDDIFMSIGQILISFNSLVFLDSYRFTVKRQRSRIWVHWQLRCWMGPHGVGGGGLRLGIRELHMTRQFLSNTNP